MRQKYNPRTDRPRNKQSRYKSEANLRYNNPRDQDEYIRDMQRQQFEMHEKLSKRQSERPSGRPNRRPSAIPYKTRKRRTNANYFFVCHGLIHGF